MLTTFAEQLKMLRRAQHLTQKDLVGPDCSRSLVAALESGKQLPTLTVAAHLARQLGVSVEALLPTTDPKILNALGTMTATASRMARDPAQRLNVVELWQAALMPIT